MSHDIKKVVWIRHFLNKLLSKQDIRRMKMLDDNKMSSTLIKNSESQNYIKHINIIYHHIKRLIEDGVLKIN